jgi:hypothetical protein
VKETLNEFEIHVNTPNHVQVICGPLLNDLKTTFPSLALNLNHMMEHMRRTTVHGTIVNVLGALLYVSPTFRMRDDDAEYVTTDA